ncbi:MAG: allophanate hydrolase, partial [Phycisphaeraceae bacterium]
MTASVQEGRISLTDVVDEVIRRRDACGHRSIWIHLVEDASLRQRADELERRRAAGEALPLLGATYAVKDNIDVAGLPTTAGCPSFAYRPERSATVVEKLEAAGAILVGKTNMDQFATGLVGTRSPHGAPRCVFNADYVSGGSSSGSAVAVAAELVSFALGTDTAGSGRVPAAFNDLTGLKPTRGRVSAAGVVPACRSLDCVSVFARSSADAAAVMRVIEGRDERDAWSRTLEDPPAERTAPDPAGFRFGVPASDALHFFGDAKSASLYAEAIARCEAIGGQRVEIDFTPFAEAAKLLYGGPWVAERYAAVGRFIEEHPTACDPTVRGIILGGSRLTAADAFRAMDRLEEYRRGAEAVWRDVDTLLLPTTGTIYRVDEITAEPLTLNTNLGRYTNFMNLLDCCGLALPAGFRENRTPFGVTLVAPAFRDETLLELGERYETAYREAATPPPLDAGPPPKTVRLAVMGAHLNGMPLNHQLTSRGATLAWSGTTSPAYRLYALAESAPPKPGLVHVGEDRGASIEVEVWELEPAAFGEFTADVPPPLAIGSVTLATGETVKGFVCEPRGLEGA